MVHIHVISLFFILIGAFCSGAIGGLFLVFKGVQQKHGVQSNDGVAQIREAGAILATRTASWINKENWYKELDELIPYFLEICIIIENYQRESQGLPLRDLVYNIEKIEIPDGIEGTKFVVRVLLTKNI